MLCVYYKTVFRNNNTGETVFYVTPKETCTYAIDGLLKCSGTISIYTRNVPIEIDGFFDSGRQLYIVTSDTISVKNEKHTVALLDYITSDITENQKKKIAKLADNDLFSFIDKKDAATELMKVFQSDTKASRIAKLIINKVRKMKEQEVITKELMSYGISIDRIELLYRKEITLSKLDNNPYIIMLKFGIPINAIEMYAFKRLKIEEYSVKRICGFLYDAMIYATLSGHTAIPLQKVVNIMRFRLKNYGLYNTIIDEALVNMCVDCLSDEMAYRIVDDIPYIYLHHIWEEETLAVSHIRRLQNSPKTFEFNNYTIDDAEKELGIIYNPNQRKAFNIVNTSGIKILTGPPGSGKTATIRGLMEYFRKNGNGVVKLSATTGMAAKVMSKACNEDAETVNLMVDVRPFDNSVQGRNLNNPVEADFIIVDEVSMLGLQLFSVLVRAIKSGSILLLVGDEDQLQSVEYGNVLHDLIKSGMIETYRLTEILRQSGTICDNAQKINNGNHNLISDSSFIMKIYDKFDDILVDLKSKFVKDKSQILSPIKKGALGTFSLNQLFQDQTATIVAIYGKKVFRIGDKVIMTRTNYDKGYINGDIGHIIGSNADETIMVQFANSTLNIERQDMLNMELADAITIHKSQGSEMDDVHIVLPTEAYNMMTRRILYTGVTRAKQKVTIYSIGDSLDKAIDDIAEKKRMTLLDKRLQPLPS